MWIVGGTRFPQAAGMVRCLARSQCPPEPYPTVAALPAGQVRGRHQVAAPPDPPVVSDLPAALSPTKAEIALLRAFLADEIDAILRDGD